MKQKLLDRPLRVFTIYALVILGCSIPVYAMVVNYIWQTELDEHNSHTKSRIVESFAQYKVPSAELDNTIQIWLKLHPGIGLKAVKSSEIQADQTYSVSRTDTTKQGANELESYRGLSSYIYILGQPYHLTIETNIEEIDETLLAITLVTVLFWGVLVLGFIVLNRYLAKRMWQPFQATLSAVKGFDLNTQTAVTLEPTNIEEFQALNEVLERLMTHSLEAFNQQKEFTENASHELQTPLALLKAKLDLLIQDKTFSGEQAQLIEALNIPLARVARVNNNMLLLAKIENQQYADSEQLDMSALVAESIELILEQLDYKGITLDHNLSTGLTLKGNKRLLEVLVMNLLVNAVRHNQTAGRIYIELNDAHFIVANTGSEALDSIMLFQRFASVSKETRGTGLGLAITQEICKRYGWTIRYQYKDGLHYFEIAF